MITETNAESYESFEWWCLVHYLGEPTGCSMPTWRCPWCMHRKPSLVCNEPMEGKKVKYRCFRCSEFANKAGCYDYWDLVWMFAPTSHYPERKLIVSKLREKFEAGEPPTEGVSRAFSFPRGRNRNARIRGLMVRDVFADLHEELVPLGIDRRNYKREVETKYLHILVRIVRKYVMHEADVARGVEVVLAYCGDFAAFIKRTDELSRLDDQDEDRRRRTDEFFDRVDAEKRKRERARNYAAVLAAVERQALLDL